MIVLTRVHALLLAATIAAVMASVFIPPAAYLAGALSLLAALIGLRLVTPRTRIVALILLGVGAVGILIGLLGGAALTGAEITRINQDLVGLLAAVSFLRLVLPQSTPSARGLRGIPAVLRTSYLVHALSSVISQSALTLSAHQLSRGGRLALPDAMIVSRAFSAAAFWSPFWSAMAVAVTYMPEANPLPAVIVGVCMSLVVLALSTIDVAIALGPDRRSYVGYALEPKLLAVPVGMAVTLVTLHGLIPSSTIPRLVALSAVIVTLCAALVSHRGDIWRALGRHATVGISNSRNETTLFTAAGVLAVGLTTGLSVLGPLHMIAEFTAETAWLTLAGMIVLAILGVHPIVSVAIVAAVVLPVHPHPTLFIITLLIGWGAGSAVGATAGLVMHLSAEFGVPIPKLIGRNLVFVGIVLICAWPTFRIIEALAL